MSEDVLAARYDRDGFVFPIDVMSPETALTYRRCIEATEAKLADRLDVSRFLRGSPHLVMPLVNELVRLPAILDAVSPILGPDLLLWNCSFFDKAPHSDGFVSWHQDLTYWGLDAADEITAWLALAPATPESGCMRFVPGSHKREIVPHRDTFAGDNLLTRGQELAVDVDEAEAVDVVLQPGQMSLHHGRMFHASGPNRSDDRRLGLAIRYIAPHMRQTVGAQDYAMLVRGKDDYGHFTLIDAPTADFAPDDVARCECIDAQEREYFYAGVPEALRG